MRIAIVSDIHGNLTALEAVLTDLRETSPDLILHGGDLGDAGARPVEVVDRIRDLGWPGVVGNTDELLFRPESLNEFAKQAPGMQPFLSAIEEMAAATRKALGPERLAWLSRLPSSFEYGPLALAHASPHCLWHAPAPEANDAELETVYKPLGVPIAVYAHIHRGFVRRIDCNSENSSLIVANTGSVSLSYDGDWRASYLLIEITESVVTPSIRRVQYDLDREIEALSMSALPHADWIARTLQCARPQMP
jgi:predicted phosphodiesterase